MLNTKTKKEKTPLQLITIGMVFGFCLGIMTFGDIYLTPILEIPVQRMIAFILSFGG